MPMLRLTLVLLALLVWNVPAMAADHAGTAVQNLDGRVGVLPESWVTALESNNISEQTALIAGGATAAAVRIGAVAGAAAGGGTVGAVLLALWIGHLPLDIALMSGSGYAAWSYLWPTEPVTDAPPTEARSS